MPSLIAPNMPPVCNAFHRVSFLSHVALNRTKWVYNCGSRARSCVQERRANQIARHPVILCYATFMDAGGGKGFEFLDSNHGRLFVGFDDARVVHRHGQNRN